MKSLSDFDNNRHCLPKRPLRSDRSLAVILLALIAILFTPSVVKSGETVTFYAVGDVMLGRNIGKIMAQRGDIYPFMNTLIYFRNADIVLGNLESVLGEGNEKLYFSDKPHNFIAPLNFSKVLKRSGFSVFSIANNHVLDYGPSALKKTRLALSKEGIAHFGAGETLEAARIPAIVNTKGIRFGFLGYGNGHSTRVFATEKSAGAAPVKMKMIINDIRSLQGKVDFLFLSLHWGIEYERYPTMEQRKMARRLIDAGADMIVGHHPHVFQGIEIYRGKVIAYSLGNFLFDQKHKGTDKSIMLQCRFKTKKIHSAEVIPLDRYNSFFPKPAKGERREEILRKVRELSLPLNGMHEYIKEDRFIMTTG